MAYSHRQIHLNACNHWGCIAETVTAQAIASFDLPLHALTPDNNATYCEAKVYTSVTNRLFAFYDP